MPTKEHQGYFVSSYSIVVRMVVALVIVSQTGLLQKGFCQEGRKGIPDLSFQVSARQSMEGKDTEVLHIFALECYGGECTLTSVRLNDCFEGAFPPFIYNSSTTTGNLKVINLGSELVVTEKVTSFDHITDYRYSFGFAIDSSKSLTLNSFSGGYLRHSAMLELVYTATFVPLDGFLVRVDLDCGTVILPGIK